MTLRSRPGTPDGPHASGCAGRGVPARTAPRGDLLVTVEVAVPEKLDGEAREALEEYRDATAGDDPRAELLDAGG